MRLDRGRAMSPLQMSEALEQNATQQLRVQEELEELGDGMKSETRALRGSLSQRLSLLKRKEFILRQRSLDFGYAKEKK